MKRVPKVYFYKTKTHVYRIESTGLVIDVSLYGQPKIGVFTDPFDLVGAVECTLDEFNFAHKEVKDYLIQNETFFL